MSQFWIGRIPDECGITPANKQLKQFSLKPLVWPPTFTERERERERESERERERERNTDQVQHILLLVFQAQHNIFIVSFSIKKTIKLDLTLAYLVY